MMSFEDTKAQVERAIIQPWLDFRGKVSPLNHIHNDCINQFGKYIGGLLTGSDGEAAFQGQGSMNLADVIGSFMTNERMLSGSDPSSLEGRLLDASIICEKHAHHLQARLDSIQPSPLAQPMMGLAVTLDAGALAQGGVDVPWDIAAGGATLLAASMANSAVEDAEMAKAEEVLEWQQDMQSKPIAEPLPKTPPTPQGPNGDNTNFFKILGITTLTAVGLGGLGALGAFTWNQIKNNQQQSQALSLLMKEFPECDQAFLEQFLEDHPDVTLDQIERALQVLRLRAQYQEFLDELMANNDPALQNGIGNLRAKVRGQFNFLRRDPFSISADQLQTVEGNLTGFWAEWQIAQQYAAGGNIFSHTTDMPYPKPGGGTGYVEVDAVIDSGKTWVEVKDVTPFTTSDPKWKNISDDMIKKFKAAQADGIQNMVCDFPQGITPEVEQQLAQIGKSYGVNVTFQSSKISVPPAGTGWCPPPSSSTPGASPTPTPTSSSSSGPGPSSLTPTPTP